VSAVLAWEVDYPDGSPLYRGRDIELAHELCHSAPVGSHLIHAAPEVTTTPAPLLSGGEK
jgi:hypothetical protein